MSVANEIKTIRQCAILSQTSFAEELGVSYTTVNRWETGKTIPNIQMMKKIVDYCKKQNISCSEMEKAWRTEKNGLDTY